MTCCLFSCWCRTCIGGTFFTLEKLSDLFSLHKASKISFHFLVEGVFKLPEYNTIREGTPICCCLSTSELFTYLNPVCVLGSLWSIFYRASYRALEHGTSLAIQSAALGLNPPLEVYMAACHRLPSFLLGDPICLCMERPLVLFWITILPNCILWYLWWFYFTFNQNVVIKSHLDNKKK